MPEKISILKESGETLSSNIVSIFMIPDTQKRYLISTENTVDPHGLTVLHVSEILDGTLQKIATDEEWSSIKTIMRAIISGNVGSYQYLQSIDNIKANSQYSRDISVSASAAKQMVDNYATRDVNNILPAVEEKADASIFPTDDTAAETAEEVVPGIAVVEAPPAPTPEPVAPAPEPVATPVAPTPEVAPAPVETPVPEPAVSVPEPPAPEPPAPAPEPAPVSQPVEAVPEVVPAPEPVAPTPEVAVPAPEPEVQSTVNVDVAVPTDTPVVVEPHMVASSPVTLPVEEPEVVAEPEPVTFVSQADLFVAPVAPEVPTAQIVQEAQPSLGIKFDVNVTPSFASNASLDELVMASQEMFLEGVKNLVQTIQEKVYREMYNKEAELKAKEEMLNQREKMLNEQMMSMMSNFATMQNKPAEAVQATTVLEENN